MSSFQQDTKNINKHTGLIKSYDVTRFMSLSYTGGLVQVAHGEGFYVSCANKIANVCEYENGKILTELEGVHIFNYH